MTGGVVKIRLTFQHIGILIHLWVILNITVSVEGWTYHPNNTLMTWNETREWCQKYHTDIVMVHNENVTEFLKEQLSSKSKSPYYWIGINNINGNWKWTANGQTTKYENWANNEPNNHNSEENCVEMYISSSTNNGKWNDDNCNKKKYPVCQKAQCTNSSCTEKMVCEEQINNFTCVCKPGFSGPQCETVVSCEQLSTPTHGWMNCSGPYGNHSLSSSCKFSCAAGYEVKGSAELKCSSSGVWNTTPPSCAVVSCEQLSTPTHGWMNCSGPYGNHSLNSSCKFSCAAGYEVKGSAELKCSSSGMWNTTPPSCAVVECSPRLWFGGGLINCTERHDSSSYGCTVQCPPAHVLLGFAEFTCRADDSWPFPLVCASYVHFLIVLIPFYVTLLFCGCLICCSNYRKTKHTVRSRILQETENPAYEADYPPPPDGPLCSA